MNNFTAQEMSQEMTKKIRKYFKSHHSLGSCIGMIALGVLIALLGREAIFLLLIGLLIAGIGVYWIVSGNFVGEAEVDQARSAQIKALSERGIRKVSLVQEQVNLVEPIVLVGFGASPDESFAQARLYDAAKNKGIIKKILSLFKLASKTYDPEEAYLIGSDERLRSLLIEVTVFYVTEGQLLMYVGDVDISTGLIYRESTAECFYQDIEATRFVQSVYKAFHLKTKKYVNRLRESFVLFMGGAQFSSSIDSEVSDTLMDEQFTAMRNLIRDKKNV